jgi:NAD(P)-dependent dehydrogenase (short-subunit alcohol dehydrogenase family)
MSQKNSLTWFITGCSSGFGRELTKVVLVRGYRAVVTAREQRRDRLLRRGRGEQRV